MTDERQDHGNSGADAAAGGTLGAGLRPTDADRMPGPIAEDQPTDLPSGDVIVSMRNVSRAFDRGACADERRGRSPRAAPDVLQPPDP